MSPPDEKFSDPGVNIPASSGAPLLRPGDGTLVVPGTTPVREYQLAAPTPSYRTLEIGAPSSWVQVEVYEPTVLRPLRTAAIASTEVQLFIWPETTPQVTHLPVGIPCAHARALLTPGRWYVRVDGIASAILFALIAAPAPLLQERLLAPQPQRVDWFSTVLAAGVESIIYDSDTFFLATGMWVENNGANGISLSFGLQSATAIRGINLPTKAASPDRSAVWFPWERMTCASLRAFSNLGSTLSTFLWLEG